LNMHMLCTCAWFENLQNNKNRLMF